MYFLFFVQTKTDKMKQTILFLSFLIPLFACSQEVIEPTGVEPKIELGSNFNHNPEIIDFYYLEKAQVDWIRTTPYIFEYIFGEREIASDHGLQNIIIAGEKEYKVAFGFRWDFKKYKLTIPAPDSERELEYFEVVKMILERIGPHIDIFKLGNEPVLETLPDDMKKGADGMIPLVVFTKRLLTKVIDPWFRSHPEISYPDIYVGSIPALFSKSIQAIDATNGLLHLAQDCDKVTGMSIHLHINEIDEIEQAFEYARKIIPEKPFIVPEFSLHRLYKNQLSDVIGSSKKGKDFAKKYSRDPDWKIYQWYTVANSKGVTKEEWKAFFDSRSWYPKHYLKTYFAFYQKYGVRLATYPLLQQSCPKQMTANSQAWFINPIFCQHSILKDENGNYSPNPLCFDDFIELVEIGRAKD